MQKARERRILRFFVKSRRLPRGGGRGRGLRGPCTLRQGTRSLASRMATRWQTENKRSPPETLGRFASSWAGENAARAREKTCFLPGPCRIFPARFARLGPASPAAQERHLPTPQGWVQGPMGPGSGLGGEEPPTSPPLPQPKAQLPFNPDGVLSDTRRFFRWISGFPPGPAVP